VASAVGSGVVSAVGSAVGSVVGSEVGSAVGSAIGPGVASGWVVGGSLVPGSMASSATTGIGANKAARSRKICEEARRRLVKDAEPRV
jgi:hypothetical protein